MSHKYKCSPKYLFLIFLHLGKTVLTEVQVEREKYEFFSQKPTITKRPSENLSKSDKDKVFLKKKNPFLIFIK